MIVVEIITQIKIILVGPFKSQPEALKWVKQILRDNPEEEAVIATNDDAPDNLRVYLGGKQKNSAARCSRSPVFEVFRRAA